MVLRISSAFDKGMTVITSFFSGFILTNIRREYTNQLQVSLIVAELLILWNLLENVLSRMLFNETLSSMWFAVDGSAKADSCEAPAQKPAGVYPAESASGWHKVFLNTVEFVNLLGLYVLMDSGLKTLSSSWNTGFL